MSISFKFIEAKTKILKTANKQLIDNFEFLAKKYVFD